MRKQLAILGALCAAGMIAPSAKAVPKIQLYIEGATYNSTTETWVTTATSFKLWVIGDTNSGADPILDMRLAIAYDGTETGSISIVGTTTSVDPPGDPSAASNPTFSFHGGVNDLPTKSDGTTLSPHGIYNDTNNVVEFDQYSLGDFTLADSDIGDFITSFPTTWTANGGQINAYNVTVTGYSAVHFDAFNHLEGSTHALFAPFSHDAGGGGDIPAPGAVVLGVMGLGLVGLLRRRTA